jgi:hypothetical protein
VIRKTPVHAKSCGGPDHQGPGRANSLHRTVRIPWPGTRSRKSNLSAPLVFPADPADFPSSEFSVCVIFQYLPVEETAVKRLNFPNCSLFWCLIVVLALRVKSSTNFPPLADFRQKISRFCGCSLCTANRFLDLTSVRLVASDVLDRFSLSSLLLLEDLSVEFYPDDITFTIPARDLTSFYQT